MTLAEPEDEATVTWYLDVYEELTSSDPEPPIGTLVEDAVGGIWYRVPEGDWIEVGWGGCEAWRTIVDAGSVTVLALP